MTLKLVKNPDIISDVARLEARPFIAGFAAETENVVANGRDKLERKGLDILFANHATSTFNSDSVAITAISKEAETEIKEGSKQLVARKLLSMIAESLSDSQQGFAA